MTEWEDGAAAMREAVAREVGERFSAAWVYVAGHPRRWMGPDEFVREMPLPDPPPKEQP